MRIQPEWLILNFVALFLASPLSTIPGLFEIISVLIGLMTLLLAVMVVLVVVQRGSVDGKR